MAAIFILPFSWAEAARADVLDLKVLVVASGTSAEDPGRALMEDLLTAVGTPYDVLDASRTELTAGQLATDLHGHYSGIILTSAELSVGGSGSAFTLPEWQLLHAYERTFHVREAVMSGFPAVNPALDLDYGLINPQGITGGNAAWVAPAGTPAVFAYVNAANPLPVTGWMVSAEPRAPGTGGPDVQPLLVRGDDPGKVLVSILRYADAREVLLSTVSVSPQQLHARVLGYEFLNFATRGMFLGARRVYLEAHDDDLFIGTAQWNPLTRTNDPANVARMTAEDVASLAWAQRALATAHPGVLRRFTLDFAFNGLGAAPGVDPLTDAFVAHRRAFRFINHTFAHLNMDSSAGTTYAMARDDIARNTQVWANLGLPGYRANLPVLISGAHSGLADGMGTADLADDIPYPQGKNDAFMQAAQDMGIRYLGSDMSRPNQGIADYVPGYDLLLLPRWPTGIFFNTSTPDLLTSEFNYVFHDRYIEAGQDPCTIPGALCAPRSYGEILDTEADVTVRHMLTYLPWPHYFHQANLHAYDAAGSTLQFDWLNTVIARYEALVTLPIQNLPYHKIGRMTRERVAARSASIGATWDPASDTVTVVSDRRVRIPVTGLAKGHRYGGQCIAEITIDDRARTFRVDRPVPGALPLLDSAPERTGHEADENDDSPCMLTDADANPTSDADIQSLKGSSHEQD